MLHNQVVKRGIWILTLIGMLSACSHPFHSSELDPTIVYTPPDYLINDKPSAFLPLTSEEAKKPWAKELILGDAFGRELDLYRAITCYKSALILLPEDKVERRLQITYDIILSYYLGRKYNDAIITFETSQLTQVNPLFPAFNNLLLMLYDCYHQVGQCDKAQELFELIQKVSPETGADLALYETLSDGELDEVQCMISSRPDQPELQPYLDIYEISAFSPQKARVLNALLPGAGYYYVGQKKSAVTSFIINALFSYAAYQFFDRGYVAAGAITTSLELGWYLGGINGAGIEAQEYNNDLYNKMTVKLLSDQKFFPVLMFETSF